MATSDSLCVGNGRIGCERDNMLWPAVLQMLLFSRREGGGEVVEDIELWTGISTRGLRR